MTSTRHRSIRQALEEILTCAMCTGRLHDPKLLSCQHSACFQCLHKWQKLSDTEGDLLTCHQCRKTTSLSAEGIQALPGDFNKNILLDILDTAVDAGSFGSNRTYCTVCDITGRMGVGAKTPAAAFCNNCRDHLCAPCLDEHNEHPLLEDHDVVVTPHGSHLSVLMCRDHRNKNLDFFCHNCCKLICSICIRTEHRDHLAEGADDVSENRKRDILQQKRAISGRLVSLKANCRAFNIDRRASAKHRIASFAAHRKSSFDVVSAISMLESLLYFCDYLLNQADPGEVVAAADHVRRRAETLLTETTQDDFTDRIIAMLCQAHLPSTSGGQSPSSPNHSPLPQNTNPLGGGGGGSLTSDDRSSLTDDASFIGSDPGGAVTDLDDNIEEVEEEDEEEVDRQSQGVVDTKMQADPSQLVPDLKMKQSQQDDAFEDMYMKDFPTDVANGSAKLLWRCSTNGPEEGQVDGPWDVTFTPAGDVITTESVNNRVQFFSDNGKEARILMSGFEPRGVTASPDGTVAIVDHTSHCVHIIPPGGSSEDAFLWKPENVANPEVLAFAPNGYRVVTDAGKHIVAVFDTEGRFLHSFGERGVGNGQFRQPLYVTVSSKGKVIVGDVHNNRIQAFTLEGKYLGKAGKRGGGEGNLNFPRGVCCDGKDHVIVSDSKNSRLTVFDHEGKWVKHLLTDQNGIKKTRGVCVTSTGDTILAVTDRDNDNSSLTVWQIK